MKKRYAIGYKCYAPAYPLKNDTPQNLRKNIASGKIETLRLESLIKFYEDTISKIGGKPILIGHSLGGNNVRKYKDKNSIVDYKVFKNRNHFVIGADGWQEVATYIENWIIQNKKSSMH